MTTKKNQPGYGKPGKHSWKTEGLRSRRNARRLARMASSMEQKKAADDRALALGECLTPKTRAELMRNYKRELAEGSITKTASKAELPRAKRRAYLREYAHKFHKPVREAWQAYQRLKA